MNKITIEVEVNIHHSIVTRLNWKVKRGLTAFLNKIIIIVSYYLLSSVN